MRKESGFSTGGGLSAVLAELESTGFLLRAVPFGKTHRDALFRLVDAFTLFYLRWSIPRSHEGPYWIDSVEKLLNDRRHSRSYFSG